MSRLGYLIVGMMLVVGCGKREQAAPEKPAPPATAPAAVTEEPRTSHISGKVLFKGTPPAPQRIRMGADPVCEGMHTEPAVTEEVVVNEDGTLRNVFVYVKTGLEAKRFGPPAGPVEIDQRGCQYHPHVFGMQAGQPLKIKNNDATLHNIHATPRNNPELNIGQPNKGMEITRTFPNPEVMIPFKCDVHPWMSSYVGVLAHPYYSVTGESGTFELRNLPAGEYVVEAWHEKFGVQMQTVRVAQDETKTIEFDFTN
jgi:plastocyanin